MKMVVICLVALAISGCANLNSVFRKTETEPGKAETILIDAKQRPITVNHVKSDQPITCVARGADALSQAAASGNLKITQPSGSGGEAGFATAEQVTSISFRTQVTEAQQEYLYQLCQLSANGILNADEVSENLRHFQNTMLAMVAIDDLAGGAHAKTAAAPSSPGGDTTPPTPPDASDPKVQAVSAAQSGVDDAQNGVKSAATKVDSAAKVVAAVKDPKALKSATDSLSAALKTYDSKQKTYATALSKLNSAVKAQKGKDAKVPTDVTSNTTDASTALKDVKANYTKVTDALTTLSKVTDAGKLKQPQDALSTALKNYTASVAKYQSAEDALGTSLTAWSGADDTSKTKNAKTGQDTGSDSAASVAVANDVTIIVQTIVWQSFITEQCQKMLFTTFVNAPLPVQKFCLDHLYRADDVREKQLLGEMAQPRPSTPTSGTPTLYVPTTNPINTPQPPQPLFTAHDQALFDYRVGEIAKREATTAVAAAAATSAELKPVPQVPSVAPQPTSPATPAPPPPPK